MYIRGVPRAAHLPSPLSRRLRRSTRESSDDSASVYVRHRHREQLPDHRRRQRPRRRDGEVRPLHALARRTSTASQELGIRFLRYGPPLHRTWLGPGRYDWGFADETFADLQAPRHHADRRPLPLRRAGLDRQLPEPRLPATVRRLRARLRRSASRGCSSTRRSTRCSSAPPSRPLRLVERAAARATAAFVTALKHIVQGQRAGDAGDPRGPARRDLHPERVVGVLPRREPGRDQAGRDLQRRAVPVARPELRPPRRLGDVRVPAGQRHDAGGVPLLPGQPPASSTASWATTTTSPTSTGSPPTARTTGLGRGLRLRRDHPAVLRPLPPAGDAHRDQPQPRARTATRR